MGNSRHLLCCGACFCIFAFHPALEVATLTFSPWTIRTASAFYDSPVTRTCRFCGDNTAVGDSTTAWPLLVAAVTSAGFTIVHSRSRQHVYSTSWRRVLRTKSSVKMLAGSLARVEGSPAAVSSRNSGAKWRTFWACFFGYSVFYFTRQSLNYTAPFLKHAMNWDGLSQLGLLSSIFPLAYGSSRFLGGVLGDLMSPRKVFAFGLIICGSLNLAFGLSSTLPQFASLWFLNGCFQGLGAPPCVKMITNWFDPKERGLWWSIWHASINLGGFLIPFLAGGLAENMGWRYGMIGPGTIALFTAVICLALMRDGPDKLDNATNPTNGDEPKQTSPEVQEDRVGIMEGLLLQPSQWAFGVAYLLVYVCRQGLAVWGVFYLMHAGVPSAAKAAALFSGFELGGFLGNLSAGALSDLALRRAKPDDGQPGQRAKVVGLYFLATALLIPALARCSAGLPWLQYLLLFLIGHFICGAQLLLPLVAAEVAPQNLLATATGFIGWVGYFGAALAGLPLSWVVHNLGWTSYFGLLFGAPLIGVCLMLPLCNARSWKQRIGIQNSA